MMITARVIGVLLLAFWISYFPIVCRYVRSHGSILDSTLLQFNILPFTVGCALLVTGRMHLLAVGVILWFLVFFLYSKKIIVPPLVIVTLGCALVVTGGMHLLAVGVILWFLVLFLHFKKIIVPPLVIATVPLIFGWTIGVWFSARYAPGSVAWYYGAGLVGWAAMIWCCAHIDGIIDAGGFKPYMTS